MIFKSSIFEESRGTEEINNNFWITYFSQKIVISRGIFQNYFYKQAHWNLLFVKCLCFIPSISYLHFPTGFLSTGWTSTLQIYYEIEFYLMEQHKSVNLEPFSV